MQQILRCPSDLLHAGRVGEGAQVGLDDYLPIAGLRKALVKTSPQASPIGNAFVNAGVVLPFRAHHQMVLREALVVRHTAIFG